MITVNDMIRLGTDKLLEFLELDTREDLAELMIQNDLITLEQLVIALNDITTLCMRCNNEYARLEDPVCHECKDILMYSE